MNRPRNHGWAACAGPLLLATTLVAQTVPGPRVAQDPVTPNGVRVDQLFKSPAGVPADGGEAIRGSRPGTERWIVLFEPSEVGVEALRIARERGLSKQAMQEMIDKIEADTLRWHEPVVERAHDLGAEVLGHLWLIDSMEVEVTKEQRLALLDHPRVRAVEPCRGVAPASAVDLRSLALGTGSSPLPIETAVDRNHHNAVAVHATGNEGQGVEIAFLDTAFDGAEPPLFQAPVPNPTFYVDGDTTNRTGGGQVGSRLTTVQLVGETDPGLEIHGTFVAAIAAGEVWNNKPEASPGHAPRASIRGYECSFAASGTTSTFLLAGAYQDVLTRRLLTGQPRIVHRGFVGMGRSMNDIDQQAADRLARIGDILSVMVGGDLNALGSNANWAFNSTIVGYVSAFNRVVSPDSPSSDGVGGLDRLFPHLVANGVDISGPFANSDLTGFGATGSSFASPQVAGAAALFFAADPTRTALEARAAILASAEDIRSRNPSSSALGAGYLRDDRFVDLALGQGLLTRGTLTNTTPLQTYPLTAMPGEQLSVGLVWDRQNDVQPVPSGASLRLRLLDGASLLAESPVYTTCAHHLRVTTPASGLVTVEVVLVGLEAGASDVEFAVAGITAPTPLALGSIVESGASCGPNSLVVDRPAMIGDQHGVFPEFVVPAPALPVLILGAATANVPIGSGACVLRVRPDVSAPISGDSITFVPVPAFPGLIGLPLFEQLLVLDPSVTEGFYLTESARLIIGGVN